jgi:hypothetical protein
MPQKGKAGNFEGMGVEPRFATWANCPAFIVKYRAKCPILQAVLVVDALAAVAGCGFASFL